MVGAGEIVARPGEGRRGVDVLLSGLLFVDVALTGLPHAPQLGTEIWADGTGTGPGGIANFAVAVSRLGLRAGLAAAVGDDPLGRYCWDALAAEGVDLSRSRFLPGWAMPLTVALAYAGDRALVSHGSPPPLDADTLVGDPPPCRAAMVHLDERPVEWVRTVRAAGGLVFADVGWDPGGTWSPEVLRRLEHCDAFLPNEGEATAYTRTGSARQALAALADRVPLAVVTCGGDGVIAVDGATGEHAAIPGLSVPVVDPTGAGDVFGAGLIVATLAGWPLVDRLRFATLTAALSVQRAGGAPSAPGWEDVRRWWVGVRVGGPEHLRADYGFLEDVLPAPADPGRAVHQPPHR